MKVRRSDLSDEEWEALHRLNRGEPEAGMVPPLMRDLMLEMGLAMRRSGAVTISYAGKQLLLRHKNEPH